MIHLIVLASKARDANLIDTTGGAAEGRGPCYVHFISISGIGGQNNQMYHDLESKAKYY